MKLSLLGTTAIFLIATAVSSPALAQVTALKAVDDPADAVAAPSEGLADIIVTAQRRSENLQRAALAVTAVSADSLTRAGVTNAAQLTNLAPALQVNNLGGPLNSFYLRGVGNFTTISLADPTVAVNIDGINLGRPSSVQGLFYDLERVEVLKGPQGTLYGRNATGGAVNVITAKPVFGVLSGYGNFEYGNYDSKKLNAAVNIPLGETGAVRIAGQLVDRNGYYSDGTGDDKGESVRVQFSSQLTDNFKITVGGDFSHQGGIGSGVTLAGLDKNSRIGIFDPRAGPVFNSAFVFRAGGTLSPPVNNAYNNNRFWGTYAQADITTSIGTLTILPAYRRSELNYRTYAPSFSLTQRETGDQTSLEVRLASKGDNPLSYILGGFFLRDTADTRGSFNQYFFAPYVRFQPVTNSYAGFGRLTYKLTDTLRITGGIRYTIDQKSAVVASDNAIVICPGAFIPPPGGPQFCFGTPSLPDGLTIPAFLQTPGGNVIPIQPYGPAGAIVQTTRSVVDASKTFRKLTYRGGVEFDVRPDSLLYAIYETGFKAGGFFSSIDDPTFRPEQISAVTVGLKNRFLDNKLQINLEAYRWIYSDQQLAHFRTNSQGGPEFVTENVGKSRIQGAEVEAQWRVLHNTTLNGTVQYLDAKNLQFVYSSPASVGPPVTGCAVSGPTAGQFQVNCSGLRPTQAPEWSFTAGIEQVIPLGEIGSLRFTAGTRYQSGIFTGFELLPVQYQAGYFTSNAQLSFTTANERFTVTGFVNNIENNNVVGYSQPHPQAPSLSIQALRPPQTYGVRVGFKF